MEQKTGNIKHQHRFKSIDALRGIAALLVMILHISHAFLVAPRIKATGHGIEDFFDIIDFGRIGITIFFIISGFVICKSFNDKQRELKGFLIKRFFRLFPLFWFSVLASAIFMWIIPGKSFSISMLLANITMLPAFLGEEFMIGLYWSLETELIFYVLASILYFFGVLKKPVVLIGLTIMLYGLVAIFQFMPNLSPALPHWKATPYHLGLMLMGVSLRYAFDAKSQDNYQKGPLSLGQWSYLHILILCAVPAAILILNVAIGFGDNLLQDSYAYLLGIIIFLIGQSLLKSSPSWLVHLGTISYSLYLLHPVVFIVIKRFVAKTSAMHGWHISIYIIICCLITILVSHWTYKLIEKPANIVGRKLASKIA